MVTPESKRNLGLSSTFGDINQIIYNGMKLVHVGTANKTAGDITRSNGVICRLQDFYKVEYAV